MYFSWRHLLPRPILATRFANRRQSLREQSGCAAKLDCQLLTVRIEIIERIEELVELILASLKTPQF